MDARKDHLVGSQVGDYVIEERIGVGGMGVVYRASQKMIGKQVAIKVLRAEVMEDPHEMERFLDEARAVSAVSHRGIIQIFSAGELVDGRQYLVMEYLKGEGLDARLLREGRLSPSDAIPILEEIASALGGVHGAGIVHRDLKPGNVFLVEQSDGRPWVKVLDFGLARRGERTDVSRIAGTPDYLSPEHSRGLPAGPPSDLYSLGVVAFQVLTGQLPFNGRTPLEVMEKHVYAEPPNPVALEPSIPDALAQLINGLLRKEPTARLQMMQVKALLKEASKQVRAASTQPGAADMAKDVLAARAAEEDRAASALTPQPGDSGVQAVGGAAGAPTPHVLPLFDALPRALTGAVPPDSKPGATPVPVVKVAGPEQARVEAAERKQRMRLYSVLVGLGIAVAIIVGFAFRQPTVQVLDTRGSDNAIQVRPEDMTTRPLKHGKAAELVDTPLVNPDEMRDEDVMPENPAAAGASDAGR